eukprot:TRINITY_DN66124_c0_g1_i3.p1 TRINITY_DN66124_c0_g1~~TRINITY_DN66124_c0_g1_i3.p1  ORF type:complete len:574 (-),score=106.37 TRINITY_DN66124_c0_g1_i3:273-1994(-)
MPFAGLAGARSAARSSYSDDARARTRNELRKQITVERARLDEPGLYESTKLDEDPDLYLQRLGFYDDSLPPKMQIKMVGHKEEAPSGLSTHTLYELRCSLQPQLSLNHLAAAAIASNGGHSVGTTGPHDVQQAEPPVQIVWRCKRRLCEFREALHDPVKKVMAADYQRFRQTPFARRGGFRGTTSRLSSWFKTFAEVFSEAGSFEKEFRLKALCFLGAPGRPRAVRAVPMAGSSNASSLKSTPTLSRATSHGSLAAGAPTLSRQGSANDSELSYALWNPGAPYLARGASHTSVGTLESAGTTTSTSSRRSAGKINLTSRRNVLISRGASSGIVRAKYPPAAMTQPKRLAPAPTCGGSEQALAMRPRQAVPASQERPAAFNAQAMSLQLLERSAANAKLREDPGQLSQAAVQGAPYQGTRAAAPVPLPDPATGDWADDDVDPHWSVHGDGYLEQYGGEHQENGTSEILPAGVISLDDAAEVLAQSQAWHGGGYSEHGATLPDLQDASNASVHSGYVLPLDALMQDGTHLYPTMYAERHELETAAMVTSFPVEQPGGDVDPSHDDVDDGEHGAWL